MILSIMLCRDTVSRSAIFCAVTTTIERCKTEGVVDVFQVVKAMRVQKPGAVQTVVGISHTWYFVGSVCVTYMHSVWYVLCLSLQEQYLSIFEALLVFIDSFETYSNFAP